MHVSMHDLCLFLYHIILYNVQFLFVETPSIKSCSLIKQTYMLFKLHNLTYQGSDKMGHIKNGILINGMLGV